MPSTAEFRKVMTESLLTKAYDACCSPLVLFTAATPTSQLPATASLLSQACCRAAGEGAGVQHSDPILYNLAAGVYDEKVLVGLDFAINEASKRGIRVVPVFANYWAMYGGIDQYNTWSFEAGSGAYCIPKPIFLNAVLCRKYRN